MPSKEFRNIANARNYPITSVDDFDRHPTASRFPPLPQGYHIENAASTSNDGYLINQGNNNIAMSKSQTAYNILHASGAIVNQHILLLFIDLRAWRIIKQQSETDGNQLAELLFISLSLLDLK